VTEIRLRFCGKQARFPATDQTRAPALRAMAKALTRAKCDPTLAEELLRDACSATPEKLRALQTYVMAETSAGLPEAAAHQSDASETFAVYADRWFDDRDRRGLSSVDTDRGRITKHVNPTLGPKQIRDVGRDDLRALVERLDDAVRAQALHWNTAKKIWGLVNKLFDDACRGKVAALRVRDDNPARDVRGPDEGEPTDKQWLHPDEVVTLLAHKDVPERWKRPQRSDPPFPGAPARRDAPSGRHWARGPE
jgi:hypothetical protein